MATFFAIAPRMPMEPLRSPFAISGTAGLVIHCFAGCAYGDPSVKPASQKRGLLPEGAAIGADDINGAKVEAKSDIKIDGVAAAESEAVPPDQCAEEEEQARTRPKTIQRKQRPKRARKRRQRSSPLGDGRFSSVPARRNSTPSQPCTRSVDAYCDWRGIARFETAPTWLRFAPGSAYIGAPGKGR